VGWYTSLSPLPLAAEAEFAQTLSAVRQALADVPDNGVGYGLLRQSGADLPRVQGDLTFNFLGEARLSLGDQASPFALDAVGSPWDVGDDFPQETPLALTSHIADGQLHLSLDWHPAEFERARMDALLHRLLQILHAAFRGAA
jgi:non-ribosomal peptide synthase protein (TIGR01720 family)